LLSFLSAIVSRMIRKGHTMTVKETKETKETM
jgi:hypothetical protein